MSEPRGRTILRVTMALAVGTLGVLHFASPDPFVSIMPRVLPAPLFLVYLSGAIEILLSAALLVPSDRVRRLAAVVHEDLLTHMRARYPGVADLGVKQGPFYVLVGSHVPCILVETSFVNHPVEGRRLAEGAYRAALADGLARGIRRFLTASRTVRPL